MNIVGHDKHLISIRDILQKEIDCYQYELNYNCEDSNTCTLPIYGINARNLLEKVYHKDYYGLSRKKQLALKLIDFYDRKIFCKQCFKELEYRNFKGKSKKKYCDFCLKEIKNERNRKNYKKAKNSKC